MDQFDDSETIALEVIDATLAGEAVEPEYADLAELTLILAGQRPVPSTAFAAELDERVARRFSRPAPAPARRQRRRLAVRAGRGARSRRRDGGRDRRVERRRDQRLELCQFEFGGGEFGARCRMLRLAEVRRRR